MEKKVAVPTLWTMAEVTEKVKAGAKLIVLGDYVLDVEKAVPTGRGYTHANENVIWYKAHPGGRKVLDSYMGKDATVAMTGGVYKHHAGAFNLIKHLRVASLKK
jgi:stearoyl-CoA desaturase (delta-9 desaturase)